MNTLHLHPGQAIAWRTWTGETAHARITQTDAYGFTYATTQGPHPHAVREDHHVWRGLRATA